MKRKPAASGSVRPFSRGGSVVVPPPDRGPVLPGTQKNTVPESLAHAELRLELDGEVTRTLSGYKAEAAERVMLVPYRSASDPASALLITKQRGLLNEKLSRMSAKAAWIAYLTWLPPALEEN